MSRHPTTKTWTFAPERPAPPPGIERVNLRELVARPGRFEHHLVVCARLGVAQLEIVTASEPLYFAHVNISDEYAVALPTGDALLDHFPMRTFVSDPATGTDLGRYNHRSGDLVLHPVGFAHWPGRLRPPYEPLAIPPGMRRCGLSLVYCAGDPTASNARPVALDGKRAGDVKPYTTNLAAPTLSLADLRGPSGIVASIGPTTLELVERPASLAPPHGGWVIVLEGDAPCDLLRISAGTRLDGAGITRALVLSGDSPPDPPPPSWRELPASPFAPFEEAARGDLPLEHDTLRVDELSASFVTVRIGDDSAEVPRYWLARMLFRIALHNFRLGYIETYNHFFVDDAYGRPDRASSVRFGLRRDDHESFLALTQSDALALVERLYRAVAPQGYIERLE